MDLKPFLIVDENIGIHLARPELAPAIFNAVDSQRDYLGKWFPWVEATRHLKDTEQFIKESMRKNTDGSGLTTFILFQQKLAGSVSVVQFNKEHKSCEVGYWLHEQFQGRGIMTQSCRVFIDHLFRSKALNRIE